MYDDCFAHAPNAEGKLPEWYALADGNRIVGCAGLIANDFISRQDLWPWLCALYIEPDMRGRALGRLLIERARADARRAGFAHIYLCTDHIGYYEKYGFTYVGQGYHPWGEESRIYEG
jgi:N-acetylglutamate synthase-like GNAT family acetyltransferase